MSAGSAQPSSIKNGIYVFGRGKLISLPNGWRVKFTTGNVLFDTRSGECSIYANVDVYTLPKRVKLLKGWSKDVNRIFDDHSLPVKEYYQLTAEEVETLWDELTSMTSDELFDYYGDKARYDEEYYEVLD